MNMARLFGVKLPQVTRYELRSRLKLIEQNTKNVLYWQYSEFLLRANRNPWYKNVLNRASFLAIDGKGLHWAMWKTMKTDALPNFYGSIVSGFWVPVRIPLFLILFTIQLLWNLLSGLFLLLTKFNFSQRTHNQVILGREFTYELLNIAVEKNWKTLIIGGSNQDSEVTKNLIQHLFPTIEINLWTRPSGSTLMKDKPVNAAPLLALPSAASSVKHSVKSPLTTQPAFAIQPGILNATLSWFFSYFWPNKPLITSENLFQSFPDLLDAQETVARIQPDLILVCIGGASGKQEFFIDALYQNPNISFSLATGLGAAIDHLGGGVKQQEAPKWMQATGLEWLFRFFTQPYRISRIIDSIITLWWWTTVEEFMKVCSSLRHTAVSMIYRKNSLGDKEFLLVQRRNVLPGDVAFSFVQGEIEAKESGLEGGLREIEEEVGLKKSDFRVISSANPGVIEHYTTSFWRFLVFKANTSSTEHYLNVLEYTGKDTPLINWEHSGASWVSHDELMNKLSPEKREDAEIMLKILANS